RGRPRPEDGDPLVPRALVGRDREVPDRGQEHGRPGRVRGRRGQALPRGDRAPGGREGRRDRQGGRGCPGADRSRPGADRAGPRASDRDGSGRRVKRRAPVVLAGALLACLAAGPAAAQGVLVTAVSGPADDLAGAILVGPSAEIYRREADGFRRRSAGGVGPDVVAACRDRAGALWAIAARTPLFRRDEGGTWHAANLTNR